MPLHLAALRAILDPLQTIHAAQPIAEPVPSILTASQLPRTADDTAHVDPLGAVVAEAGEEQP